RTLEEQEGEVDLCAGRGWGRGEADGMGPPGMGADAVALAQERTYGGRPFVGAHPRRVAQHDIEAVDAGEMHAEAEERQGTGTCDVAAERLHLAESGPQCWQAHARHLSVRCRHAEQVDVSSACMELPHIVRDVMCERVE